MQLRVVEICGESRVFRADGAKLRVAIEYVWLTDDVAEINFEHIRIASVSFFDEGLGLLALQHPISVLQKRIRITNITEEDRTLLNQILSTRRE